MGSGCNSHHKQALSVRNFWLCMHSTIALIVALEKLNIRMQIKERNFYFRRAIFDAYVHFLFLSKSCMNPFKLYNFNLTLIQYYILASPYLNCLTESLVVNKQGQKSMKTAIKKFQAFSSLQQQRSNIGPHFRK